MFVYMYIIFIFAKFSKPLKTRLFKWLLTSAYKQKYIHTNKHKYVCIYVHIFLVPFFTHSLLSLLGFCSVLLVDSRSPLRLTCYRLMFLYVSPTTD